jgi:tetratricopeptide (TPR) repeat protein
LAAFTSSGAPAAPGPDAILTPCLHHSAFATIAGCTAVIDSSNANLADKFTAYIFRGIAYRITNHPAQALADANSAIMLNPGSYLGYGERAIDYLQQYQPDRAIADDTTAISLDPANGRLYYERSLAYSDKGLWTSALKDETQAVTLNPLDAGAFAQLGVIYDQLGEWENDIAASTKAISINPKLEPAYLERGVAYLYTGAFDKSAADEAEAVKLGPLNALAWNNLCYDQAILGKLDEALQNCNTAILLGLGANEEMFYNSRAYVYLQMKNYPLAIADYKVSLKMAPDDSDSLYGLALAEKANGDAADSAADFAAAKKINPDIVQEFAKHDVP